jgi:hypothetical protein
LSNHQLNLSPECKNVASGHAIDSIFMFFDKIKNKKPVIVFSNAGLITAEQQ